LNPKGDRQGAKDAKAGREEQAKPPMTPMVTDLEFNKDELCIGA
jgi:hypothetical protein